MLLFKQCKLFEYYKVGERSIDRAACVPQPPINQPTGPQMSRQGLYFPETAYFWGKIAVFGPNILIILGGSKVLVPTYQKTT